MVIDKDVIPKGTPAAPAATNNRYRSDWLNKVANAPQTDPTKAGSSSDRMGGITREEWQDYINRFIPVEDTLVGLATGQQDNDEAIARARGSVVGAYDVSQGTMQRDRERFGLANAGANPDEMPALQARTGLGKVASEVSAINGARTETNNRDMQLLSGNMAVGLKSAQR